MFDIGWIELFVVALVALVVLGPQDFPKALYGMGRWIGRLQNMLRQFRYTFDEMAQREEFEKVQKQLESMGDTDVVDAKKNPAILDQPEVKKAPKKAPAKNKAAPAANKTTAAKKTTATKKPSTTKKKTTKPKKETKS